MIYKFLLSLFFLFFLTGCAGSVTTQDEHLVFLKKLASERYGTATRFIFNSDKTFSIAVKQEKASAQNTNPLLQYFVFDLEKEKIVFEDDVPGGSIFWKDNDRVEVRATPGIVQINDGNNLYGYIYNVISGTKSELNPVSENN